MAFITIVLKWAFSSHLNVASVWDTIIKLLSVQFLLYFDDYKSNICFYFRNPAPGNNNQNNFGAGTKRLIKE